MHKGWQRAFNVCIAIFTTTLIIAITAIITNWLLPDEIFNDPAYTSPIGVRYVVGFIKAIDTADFYATILSGIASGFTYFIKSLP